MSKSDKFLKEVCKLCGGDNDHQSKCQMDDVEDIPFWEVCLYVVCVCKPVVNQ